jgi:hypothetical protein
LTSAIIEKGCLGLISLTDLLATSLLVVMGDLVIGSFFYGSFSGLSTLLGMFSFLMRIVEGTLEALQVYLKF